MAEQNIDVMVKTIIETQIIQSLNNAPEAIDKLVKAALSKPVDKGGNFEGDRHFSSYGGTTPYLDWMVGQEIRSAAEGAVRKVISESASVIEAKVREGLSSDTVVAALTKAFVSAAEQDWRIDVKFEAEKKKDY